MSGARRTCDEFRYATFVYRQGVGYVSGKRVTSTQPLGFAAQLRATGVIAIVRGDFPVRHLTDIATALAEGGVRIMEITLNSQNALEAIESVHSRATEGAAVAARTARDVDQAQAPGAILRRADGVRVDLREE